MVLGSFTSSLAKRWGHVPLAVDDLVVRDSQVVLAKRISLRLRVVLVPRSLPRLQPVAVQVLVDRQPGDLPLAPSPVLRRITTCSIEEVHVLRPSEQHRIGEI